ncbi:MAG: photosynthesis system II assembly factor Ycf48 [Leptolyngbyaceae bacterium]|nr:photosynthesis system II assembly factor Ycf48 [Leptolyngbyaceae bacterium]
MHSIVNNLKRIGTLLAVVLLCVGCAGYLPSLSYNPWQVISVPTESFLSDLSFINPLHGWLVGSSSTLLETNDGGETWESRNLDLDGQNYRFTSVSFSGQEGWVAGQPSILLHTTDGGQSWLRVPLSSKLPGNPNTVTALQPQTAEMTTDIGAIYKTTDGGKTWKALVQEAVGVVRNIQRSPDGKYVAVSAKGNFYSVWEPGQEAWVPHNRNSSRRVQNMGFAEDGRLWMIARGGQLQFTKADNPEEWDKATSPEFVTSWGFLDLAYRTPNEIWLSGGSGNLLCSLDGGQTWQKDQGVQNVPSNLYKILFITPEQGFIIGQQGTLLKYKGAADSV